VKAALYQTAPDSTSGASTTSRRIAVAQRPVESCAERRAQDRAGQREQSEPDRLDASHAPNVTAPAALMALLAKTVT